MYKALALAVVGILLTSTSLVSASTYTVTLKDDDKAYILKEADLAPEAWESMTDDEKKDYIDDLLENHKDSIDVTYLAAPTPTVTDAAAAVVESVPSEDIAADIPAATEGLEAFETEAPEEPEIESPESADDAVGETTDESVGESSDETADESAGGASGETADESAGESFDETVDENAGGASDETADESADEASSTQSPGDADQSEELPKDESVSENNAADFAGSSLITTDKTPQDEAENSENAEVTVETAETGVTTQTVDNSLARGDLGVDLLITADETAEEVINGAPADEALNQSGPGSTELVGDVDKKPSGSSGQSGNSGALGSSGSVSGGSSASGSAASSSGTASTDKTSASDNKKTTSPKTGDSAEPLMYMGLALGAAAMGSLTVFGRKKEKNTNKNQ